MIGQNLGPYEILSLLGQGGMGVVYKGRDTRLDRLVAIKELPAALAADPDRLGRFEREARTLAQLNHPNVTSIHGVEEHEGRRFLVLEYVEGESLQARLQRGPMPVDEALDVASQIAAGVAAAHDAGVIHRDLKPANVMVTPEGRATVLDFGLARSADPDEASGADAHAPTMLSPAQNSPTLAGAILGTAAYMSPEQARGRRLDRRTDVWSFGVVLYEMLTGISPFDGETVSDCIGAVLHREVDFGALSADTPASVRRLLRLCLARDRDERLRDLGDLRLELIRARRGESAFDGVASGTTQLAAAPRISRATWIVGAVAVIAALVVGMTLAQRLGDGELPRRPPLVASILTPRGTEIYLDSSSPSVPSLSPDGQWLVYGGQDRRQVFELYLVELATGKTRVLEGTESGQYPFWSPDSRSIGFFAGGRGLLRMERAGGPPRVLRPRDGAGKGGTWLEDGRIVYSSDPRSPLSIVDAETGESQPFSQLDLSRDEISHRQPRRIFGHDALLYLRRNTKAVAEDEPAEIWARTLDGSIDRFLVASWGNAAYHDGNVLYVVDGVLVARPFDPDRLEFTGEPVSVAADVLVLPGASLSVFDVAPTGALTYVPRRTSPQLERLVWRDRQGNYLETALDDTDIDAMVLVGDRTRVSLHILDRDTRELQRVLYDLRTGRMRRFEEEIPSTAMVSVSNDGTRYVHDRREVQSVLLLVSSVDAFVSPTTIAEFGESARSLIHSGWSADDRYVYVITSEDGESQRTSVYYRVPTNGRGEPEPIDVPANTRGIIPSPDGRWFAYHVGRGEQYHVFVAPADRPTEAVRMSDRSSWNARWRRDGKELFLQGEDRMLYVIDTSANRAEDFPAPEPLFPLEVVPRSSWQGAYDVSADGTKVLTLEAVSNDGFAAITFMSDWVGSVGGK